VLREWSQLNWISHIDERVRFQHHKTETMLYEYLKTPLLSDSCLLVL